MTKLHQLEAVRAFSAAHENKQDYPISGSVVVNGMSMQYKAKTGRIHMGMLSYKILSEADIQEAVRPTPMHNPLNGK